MVSGTWGNSTNHARRRTKQAAAEDLAEVMGRSGIYTTSGVLIEMFDKHWSKLSLLAHEIHEGEC